MARAVAAVVFPALLSAGVALADSPTDAQDVITTLAAALAGDNVPLFFQPIDRAMPGYAKLRAQLEALTARAQIASSIDFVENEGDDARRTLLLDWYVEIQSRGVSVSDKTERRRKAVRCVVAKSGKSWRVVELDTADLFE
ncbi:MAG: hypothetical protein ABI823_19730 [Bryobacteraceae bacterium]